jgi:3-oxoacyl-[acyl-carrier protein] reductase
MKIDLSGQRVLVTGGTRGIGRAIVEAFVEAGARVAFTFRSSVEEAQRVVDAVQALGGEARAVQADGADLTAAMHAVDSTIQVWGGIDILVNNAGITRDNLMLRMSEADWDAVVDTNLKSVFNFGKAVYRPMMKQRAGKIINMSSVVGITGNRGQTNYAASKAGIIGFSKSLARELGGRGITVNVVAPGYVETDMTASLPEAARQAMLGAVPLGRAARPSDVAAAVLFLASSAADYITGHVLHVDGGLAM